VLFKKRPRLTRAEALAALPLRNSSVQTQELPGGELAVIIPRRNSPLLLLLSLVFMIPKQRQVVLDAVGAGVWRLCDGEHSVADLIAAVQEEHRLNRKEAEASITAYLRRLGKRGLVAFAVRKEQGS
jgi:hypothetical protein